MRYLRAELIRTVGTFTMWLPAVLAAVAVLSRLLAGGAALSSPLAAAHLYPVGFLLPLAMTTAVVAEFREHRLRAGGTLWRATNPYAVQLARVAVTTGYAAVGHLLMAAVLIGTAGTAAAFVVVETAVFLGGYGLGLLMWRLTHQAGLCLAPVAGLSLSLFGAMQAELPDWPLRPWTWSIRPTLPVFGVHGNSVPAGLGAEIWEYSVAIPLLLHVALGAVAWLLAMQIRPRQLRAGAASRARKLPVTTRTSISRALALTLPWQTWALLSALMWALLWLIRAGYGREVSAAAFSFAALPVAASVVGIMAWTGQRVAWRSVLLRRRGNRLVLSLFGLMMVFLVPVLLVGAVLAGAGIYQLIVTPFVAALILAVCLLAATRAVAAAIVVTVAMTAWSLMIGGDILNETGWWWSSAWSWTWTVVAHPERWPLVVAVSSGLSALTVAITVKIAPRLAR